MTNWITARGAIATVLGTVTITSPVALAIKKVYETQPDTIVDYPCFVIVDAARRVLRGSGKREKFYEVRIRFLVRDADLNRAAEIIDAFEEATIDRFDIATKLNLVGNYHVIEGPNWEEKQPYDEGNNLRGVDGILMLTLKDAVAFAP